MDVINQLTLLDIHHIIAAKFFLLLFVAVGVLTIWKSLPIWIFLLVTGLSAAGAYLVLVNDLQLMFWGLQGDEITIAAMYEMFAHHSLGADFGYPILPPFYPPLFFWIFSLVGRAFGWHGVMIAKVASAASILLFPIGIYLAQVFAFRFLRPHTNGPSSRAWLLAPLICFVVIDWDAIILKPYELIASAGTVIWSASLFLRLWFRQWSWRHILIYAFFGGLLFLTYYLWLIFAAIGLSIAMLWVGKKEQWRFYQAFALVGIGILLFSLPFLFPLIRAYATAGSENWQTILMTLKGISLHTPFFSAFTWDHLVLLGGFVALIILRNHVYGRVLLLLFLSSYIWQIMGLTTIFFFDTPIQEFKGFYFFNRIILSFSLAFGIERLWQWGATKPYAHIGKKSAAYIGVCFLATQMIFGLFLDDPAVQLVRARSRQLPTTAAELVTFLREDQRDNSALPITLHSGIGHLHAFVPLRMYLYLNQHNTHPAAHFSSRFYDLQWAFSAPSEAEFYHRIKEISYGPIDRFIFFKEAQKETYDVRIFIDNFPHEARVDVLSVPKNYFAEPFVRTVFENEQYIIFDVLDS